MARRLLLMEGEELLLRVRPHAASYLRCYLTALLWLVPGALGSALAITVGGEHAADWGLSVFILTVALWRLARRFLVRRNKDDAPSRRPGAAFAWTLSLLAAALILLDVFQPALVGALGFLLPAALGVVAAVLRIVYWEVDRMARLHFVTTERLVIRGGLMSRHERTVHWAKVQEVRSLRGPLGMMFDYGDVTLVTSKSVRGKEAKVVEASEQLTGIGHLEQVKHQAEQLVAEQRLPTRDRQKRLQERRVKDSMRALARWMRKEGRRA